MLKLKLNHWLPKYFLKPFGFEAITLFPYVLVASKTTSIYLARHEFQHALQIEDDGFIMFYLRYIGEFIVNLVRYKNWMDAYYNISYEIEASDLSHDIYDPDFLGWLEHIVKVNVKGQRITTKSAKNKVIN